MPLFTVIESSDGGEGIGYSQYDVATPLAALREWVKEMTDPEVQAKGFLSKENLLRVLHRNPPRSASPRFPGVWSASLGYRQKYLYLIAVRTQRAPRADRP